MGTVTLEIHLYLNTSFGKFWISIGLDSPLSVLNFLHVGLVQVNMTASDRF